MANLSKDSMAKLLELNIKITRKAEFTQKIKIIADTVKDIIKANRCSIFVHDKKSHSFWTVHTDGISFMELPDNKGIISEVYKKKETIIINDVITENEKILSVDLNYVVKSIISMPILGFDEECIGVVQLMNKEDENGFTDLDAKTLQFVVNHFTTFIQLIVQEN